MEETNNYCDFQTEEPTSYLQWNDGVLQQQWKINTVKNHICQSIDMEWRDIPNAPKQADRACEG